MNALVKEARTITLARDIAGRVKALDWERDRTTWMRRDAR